MDDLLASKIGLGESMAVRKRVDGNEKPRLMDTLVETAIADSLVHTSFGASVVYVDRSRSLVEACQRGDLSAVKNSLRKGASLNDSVEMKEFSLLSETLFSAMHMAARYGHAEVLKYLYSLDPNLIHQVNRYNGLTVLDFAMFGGQEVTDLVRSWLNTGSSSIELKDQFTMACINGDLGILKIIEKLPKEAILKRLDSYQNSLGQNFVHYAAYFGHLEVLNWLDALGCSLATQDKEGRSASHFAVLGNQNPVVRWLYRIRQFQHRKDASGKTAGDLAVDQCHLPVLRFLVNSDIIHHLLPSILHTAAAQGNVEVLKWLLEGRKIDFYTKDAMDNTALHIAASNNQIGVIDWWVDAKLDINVPGRHGMILPQLAVWDGILDVLKWWKVNMRPVNDDFSGGEDDNHAWNEYFKRLSIDGLHLPICLVLRGHKHILEWWHAEKLEMDVCDLQHQRNTAHWAIVTRNLDLLKWLDSVGVDLGAKGRNGKTCGHYAAKYGCLQVLEYLKLKQMDLRVCTKHDQSLAHYAAKNGHVSVLDWLKDAGFPIDDRDIAGRTPFHLACKKGHLHVLSWLNSLQLSNLIVPTTAGEHVVHLIALSGNVEALQWCKTIPQVDFTIEDAFGRNVTYWAAFSGSINVMTFLKEECLLEIDSECRFGARQFHHAASNGHHELLDWFRAQGVDISGLASDGSTIAHFAAVHLETMKWILSQNLPLNEPSTSGLTPIIVANVQGAQNVVEWIKDYAGVQVSSQDLELLETDY